MPTSASGRSRCPVRTPATVHYTAGVAVQSDNSTGRTTAPGTPGAQSRFRLLDPVPLSILLALILTVAGLVSLLARHGTPAGSRPDDAMLTALTVASAVPLAFLWWSPFACLAVTGTLLVVQSAAGYQYAAASVWAVVIASFATVAFDSTRRALAGGFVFTAGFIAVILTTNGLRWQEAIATWVSISLIWAVAVALRLYRNSAERAERRAALFSADRDARAREAVEQERIRLARELHDSVGHALNVMVLHAGAAQRVMGTKPELAREALASIETASRQALGDIERILGILRTPEEESGLNAAPGLAQLDELCARVREAGLPVALTVEGAPQPLPTSLDLTAFRIVQEALTNTLKHAGKTQARVSLRYAAGEFVIDVLDDGRGVAPGVTGGGRGLLGMRERVVAFRGELTAGPRAEGGFAVHARLPLETEGR